MPNDLSRYVDPSPAETGRGARKERADPRVPIFPQFRLHTPSWLRRAIHHRDCCLSPLSPLYARRGTRPRRRKRRRTARHRPKAEAGRKGAHPAEEGEGAGRCGCCGCSRRGAAVCVAAGELAASSKAAQQQLQSSFGACGSSIGASTGEGGSCSCREAAAHMVADFLQATAAEGGARDGLLSEPLHILRIRQHAAE